MDIPAGLEGTIPQESATEIGELPEVEISPELQVLDGFGSLDEPGELEELDELEDADVLEDEPAATGGDAGQRDSSDSANTTPTETLDDILSRIEFSDISPSREAAEALSDPRIGDDPLASLDIISPFDDMLDNFFAFEPEPAPDGELEELVVWDDIENESAAELEAVDQETAYIPRFTSDVAVEFLPLADGQSEEDIGELVEVEDSIVTEGEDGLVLIDLARVTEQEKSAIPQDRDPELGALVSSVMGPGPGRRQRRR